MVHAKEYEEPITFSLLKERVRALHTPAKYVLLRTVVRAESLASRGKVKKANRVPHVFNRQARFLAKKKTPTFIRITQEEKQTLLDMSNTLRKTLSHNKK